jgi:DNA repair protein RecO (recombination protein O)
MEPIKTEAIILRRINYGESDRILQLLTPNNGKVSAIAKSVRKEGSKLAGGIELLAISDVVVRFGKSDLGIITSARLRKFFTNIMEDYDRLQFSYEALKRFSKLDDYLNEPRFYEIAKTTLESLNNKSRPWFKSRQR